MNKKTFQQNFVEKTSARSKPTTESRGRMWRNGAFENGIVEVPGRGIK